MPWRYTSQVGDDGTEHIGVDRCVCPVSSCLNEGTCRRPEQGIHAEGVQDILVRIDLPEFLQHTVCILLILIADHRELFLLRIPTLVSEEPHKGEFSKHRAVDDGDAAAFLTESLKTPGTRIDSFHRDRFEEHHPAGDAQILCSLLGSCRDPVIWKSIDLFDRILCKAEQLHCAVGDAEALFDPRLLGYISGCSQRAALYDPFVEETVGYGHLEKHLHLAASAGLTEDGHIVRITAEGGDIIPHPFQRQYDIHHSQAAGIPVLLPVAGQVHEPDTVQPVVQ